MILGLMKGALVNEYGGVLRGQRRALRDKRQRQ